MTTSRSEPLRRKDFTFGEAVEFSNGNAWAEVYDCDGIRRGFLHRDSLKGPWRPSLDLWRRLGGEIADRPSGTREQTEDVIRKRAAKKE